MSYIMGQSNLLKMSGNTSSIPRVHDYHVNLEKDTRHNLASPTTYKLPALFDEFHDRNDRLGVKYNPHAVFPSNEKNPDF
jgi:hypothetical protein